MFLVIYANTTFPLFIVIFVNPHQKNFLCPYIEKNVSTIVICDLLLVICDLCQGGREERTKMNSIYGGKIHVLPGVR